MSYIESHKARLEQRHYVVDAFTETMWFYFSADRNRNFIEAYGYDFCLVISGSPMFDHAFILPYKDFKDFFSPELLDGSHRWVCNIRANEEMIRLSHGGRSKTRPLSVYHNAFHLLQDVPAYLRPSPEIDNNLL